MKKNFAISLMFPLYKDRGTVRAMINNSEKILKKLKKKYEIVIVDDGCPEKSGLLEKKIAKKKKNIRVILHKKNLGYGAAIRTGLKKCKNDLIFAIDGDAEYSVNDLPRLIKA